MNLDCIEEEIQETEADIEGLVSVIESHFEKDYRNWAVIEAYAEDLSKKAAHVRYLKTLKSTHSHE